MSLFGSIGKLVGKGLKTVGGVAAKAVPGGSLVAGGVAVGSKLLKRVDRKVIKGAAVAAGAGVAGAGIAGLMGSRGSGERKRYRRINPGNTRALRRAVRRIEQGAKMYSKVFGIKHGSIHGAPKVRLKGRRAA